MAPSFGRSSSRGSSESQSKRFSVRWSIGLTILLSLITTVLFIATSAFAQPSQQLPASAQSSEELINVVFDSAGLFSEAEKEELNLQAKSLLEDYGTAMAVEVVPTVNGRSIEDWTVDRANERRVGSSELNNGLFYGIALDDREFYVAKGDGYAAIPDYKLKSILDSQMVPRFKDGDFAGGIISSSQAFGELAVSPSATVDTAAIEREEQAQRDAQRSAELQESLAAVTPWLIGGGSVLVVGLSGAFVVRGISRRRQEKEAALRRAEEERIAEEKRKAKEAARVKRVAAISAISDGDWRKFAKLSGLSERTVWLSERSVYKDAFGLFGDEKPTSEQVNLLESTISDERFGGIPIPDELSVEEAKVAHAKERERQRIAQVEADRKRREKQKIEDEAKDFWRGLSSTEKREYGRLRGEEDRRRWVSDHGGANIFGLHPAIAIAMFMSLSNDHVRAEQRAADEAARSNSSSTDYSSSSLTNYSSGNMFGGGSFGGGGGSGGSW